MKKTFVLLICMAISTILYAYSWTEGERSENSINYTRDDGKTVLINGSSEISSEVAKKVTNCLDTIWAIPGLQGVKASALIDTDSKFSFVIYPEKLSTSNKDLTQYIPSGLAFSYDSALFYNVVLKVGELMPKLQGPYIASDDFLAQMLKVTEFPDLFMYDSYIIERLDKLENALMAVSKKSLFSKAEYVSKDIVLAVRSLYNNNPAITQKEVATQLKEMGLQASSADISAVFMVYLGKL